MKGVLPTNPRFLGPSAAILVLIAFWIGILASLREKSLTLDEGVHVTAGYAFWRYNDYRLNPENGNLPERVMALPLLVGDYRFPIRINGLLPGSGFINWAMTRVK